MVWVIRKSGDLPPKKMLPGTYHGGEDIPWFGTVPSPYPTHRWKSEHHRLKGGKLGRKREVDPSP